MVDHIIVMNTCDDVGRGIVLLELLQALVGLFWVIPAALTGFGLLEFSDLAEESNMTRRKEIKPAIDIDNALSRSGSLSIHQCLKLASFLKHMVQLRGARTTPCPHLGSGLQTALVGSIVFNSTQKICGRSLALFGASDSFMSRKCSLDRLDKVVPGA